MPHDINLSECCPKLQSPWPNRTISSTDNTLAITAPTAQFFQSHFNPFQSLSIPVGFHIGVSTCSSEVIFNAGTPLTSHRRQLSVDAHSTYSSSSTQFDYLAH